VLHGPSLNRGIGWGVKRGKRGQLMEKGGPPPKTRKIKKSDDRKEVTECRMGEGR